MVNHYQLELKTCLIFWNISFNGCSRSHRTSGQLGSQSGLLGVHILSSSVVLNHVEYMSTLLGEFYRL